MFTTKKQDASYPLGIRPHRMITYLWERPFLRGHIAIAADDRTQCLLSVEAHLPRLRERDAAPLVRDTQSLRPQFNETRNTTLHLGAYPSLDTIEKYTGTLEDYFKTILRERGAEHRVLRGDALTLTNDETEASFGDALRRARDLEVYTALRDGHNLPLAQITGRVFRSLAHTLGVDYTLTEERDVKNPDHRRSVTFLYDQIGSFTFAENGAEPVTVTRRSYNGNGGYSESFSGPATLENMQRHVFNWLIDALREVTPQRLPDEKSYNDFLKNHEEAEKFFYGKIDAQNGIRRTGIDRDKFLRLAP